MSPVRRNRTGSVRVGPRGLEPRTCGLRVWSEGAGQRAVLALSRAFVSQCYPLFPIVSRSFTGMRRGCDACRRCHFDHTRGGCRRCHEANAPPRRCVHRFRRGPCDRKIGGSPGRDSACRPESCRVTLSEHGPASASRVEHPPRQSPLGSHGHGCVEEVLEGLERLGALRRDQLVPVPLALHRRIGWFLILMANASGRSH